MTIMLGRLSAGPASSSANAGPLPMPEPINPCKIGTSVNVAKYMNAPATLAIRLDCRLLPPTRPVIQESGMIPASVPARPVKNPATKTPPMSSGNTCLAKNQVLSFQSVRSSPSNQLKLVQRTIARLMPASHHFISNMVANTPSVVCGLPQLANTKNATIDA